MLRSIFKLFMKLMTVVIPVRVVSTFFGIGHLPAWQEHWASLAVLLMTHTVCYIVYGSFPPLAEAASGSGLVLAAFFLQVSVCIFILGLVSVFICLSDKDSSISLGEAVVVQYSFGQLLTASIGMPASVSMYETLAHVYNGICVKVFGCPVWFNYVMHLFIFFIVPFVFYNVVIIIKPWPMSFLQLRYSNCFSVMMEGVVLAFYSILSMYTIAFIFSGLYVTGAIKYFGAILQGAIGGAIW